MGDRVAVCVCLLCAVMAALCVSGCIHAQIGNMR
jgi:hypothetical protein